MKKIVVFLAFVAGLVCTIGCTSNTKRAHELIAEYQQKANEANIELNEIALGIDLTPEVDAYVQAYASSYAYRTAIKVAENWELTTDALEYEAIKYTVRAENLSIPLTAEQQVYRSKYTEVVQYNAVVDVLERWVELHSK